MPHDLAFIGAGNMAEAIARGLLSSGAMTADRLIAADVAEPRRKFFAEQLKITAVEQPADAAREAKAIILAVKPQQMPSVLAELGAAISEKTLVVSIAAGVTTRQIEIGLGLGRQWKVVRTMPNTPMLVGQGAVAIAPGAFATKADVTAAKTFFTPAAEVIEVGEDKLDAVTALSGSGPAYVFYLTEHMIAAGIEMGLTAEHAALLARQTVMGAATMAKSSANSPQELRRKVTSPNGTTQAAIESLDAAGVGPAVRAAIGAAAKRSVELREAATK
ncbi:MAG TPA: pyrroline-5-carboxylate reductase [Tepidisphaeraceae bacterium]|jgi:pyrroline-5-carboxylate reductase